LCIARWLRGDIWWDPFQFVFSGQTEFYNGNFSPQEEVLACKRTNETVSLLFNPTTLETDETLGIEAGTIGAFRVSFILLHYFGLINSVYERAKAMPFNFCYPQWSSVPSTSSVACCCY
jgi:hypothetical protein